MKINKKNILTVGAIYLGLLACLEFIGQFAIRYIESRRPSGIYAENIMSLREPLLDFTLKMNVNENFPGWTVKTNGFGYRGEDFALKKPKDTLRIVMVGGSTVFGWGVNQAESIPSYLEKLIKSEMAKGRSLASNPKKIQIINAGVPWYASWNEAAYVLHRVFTLEPDWIISFDGLNDAAKSLAPEWHPVYMGYEDAATSLVRERWDRKVEAKDFLLEVLKLSPTVRYVYSKIKMKREMRTGAYHPEIWDQYLHYQELMSSLCKGRGVMFSSFLQPVMMVDKPLDPLEVATNYTSMQDKNVAITFQEVYRLGEKAVLNSHLKFVNLTGIFKDTKEVIYLDGLHYNSLGNSILADAIFEQEVKPRLPQVLASRFKEHP